MNVLFHTATAIGIAILLMDAENIKQSTISKRVLLTGCLAFTLGIISHGVLDYIPHCYPIHSAFDAMAGLVVIGTTIWLTNKKYRLITELSFLGCLFPDLVDLAPAIINKELRLGLPIIEKIFPWHLRQYSGSIYNGNCGNSTLNHILLLVTLGIVCWYRRRDMKIMFSDNI